MAFLKSSRYASVETVDVPDKGGRPRKAIKLRRLPSPLAAPYTVEERDRLDTVAQRQFGDGTKFWHIADANTELEANRLADTPGRVIQLPSD